MMVITLLAIVFLLFIIVMIFFGKSLLLGQQNPDDPYTEKCSICRGKFHKSKLVERQIGDYKLLFFCRGCIEQLTRDKSKLPE